MSILILLTFLLASSVQGSKYRIIPRRDLQVDSISPAASPQMVSFDGDLDYIKDLAMAKAKQSISTAPSSLAPSPSPTSDNGTVSNSTILDVLRCIGATIGHLEILTFKYRIETAPGANISIVIGEVQEILLEEIVPYTLSCRNKTNEFAKIVALDSSLPADTPSDEACKPDIDSKNECTVVNGRIRLFLSNRDTADDAITLATKQIQKAFGKSIFVNRVETGLRKITFIPDEISEIQDNSISKVSSGREAADDENRISPTSSFLVAFASALLAALVGSVYYLRQGKKRDVEALQEEDGSSFAPPIQNKVRPTSPFSEMLPGAYRMGDLDKMSMLSNSNMSPVYEDEDGSSSVVVSESGYTTEAAGTDGGDDSSLTFSKRALYTPEEEKDYMSSSSLDCLGAIPRDGNQFTSDLEMSDSDFDASSVESSQTSPLKTYSTSLLLPQGHQDESMTAEDILLFENAETVVIENSMVDVSLSEP